MNTDKKHPSQILTLLLVVMVASVFFYTERNHIDKESSLASSLSSQQEMLEKYHVEINKLKLEAEKQTKKIAEVENTSSENNQVINKTIKKAELENKIIENKATQKISALEAKLANSPKDLIRIIGEWKPRVAKISCIWKDTSGKTYATGGGSGFIFKENTESVEHTWVLTNKHVFLDNNKYTPYTCTIKLPELESGLEIDFKSGNYHIIEPLDIGLIEVINPDTYIKSLTTVKKTFTEVFCQYKASLGEKIAILGYPTIGTIGDITATEGIISGYDGDFYITSAKIERGNSGGIALSIEKNCILGIPTFAKKGEIETLGRILTTQAIFKAWNVQLGQ